MSALTILLVIRSIISFSLTAPPESTDDIAFWSSGLSSAEPRDRANAVQALGYLHAQERLNELLAALEDRDAIVRLRAADAIGDIGPAASNSLPALIKVINDARFIDHSNENRIVLAISRIGGPSVPVLEQAVRTGDAGTRLQALDGLKRLGASAGSTAPFLAQLYNTVDRREKHAILETLGGIAKGDRQTQSFLKAELAKVRSTRLEEFELIYKQLAALGFPPCELISEEKVWREAESRATALDLLEASLPDSHVCSPTLHRLAEDPDPEVRAFALAGLSLLEPPTPALLESLLSNLDGSPREVTLALARIGGPAKPILPKLITRARNDNTALLIDDCLVEALLRIDPFGPDTLTELLRLFECDLTVHGITPEEALGMIGPAARAATRPLVERFVLQADLDNNRFVLRDVGSALTKIGVNGGAALPSLRRALEDQNKQSIHRAALQIWSEIGPPDEESLKLIARYLESGRVGERIAAARVMGLSGPRARTYLAKIEDTISECVPLTAASSAAAAPYRIDPGRKPFVEEYLRKAGPLLSPIQRCRIEGEIGKSSKMSAFIANRLVDDIFNEMKTPLQPERARPTPFPYSRYSLQVLENRFYILGRLGVGAISVYSKVATLATSRDLLIQSWARRTLRAIRPPLEPLDK